MKKSVMLLLCLLVVFSSIPFAYGENFSNDADKSAFVDIDGHWAEETINRIAKKGIVNGVGGNRFDPDASMTRSQFASLLHKALGLQIRYFRTCNINEIYSDVQNDAWYANQLHDLVTTGIVDDRAAFKPGNFITREEMAHYIIKAYEYKRGITLSPELTTLDSFKDKADISLLFVEEAGKAVKLKLLTGKGNNLFKPLAESTRAEVVVVIDRFLNLLNTDLN